MADISYICKRKLLTKLWDELPRSWKILVADQVALKVISSFCGMDDLLNNDILDVNNLEKKREPFMCPALYLISPSQESVDKIISEFSNEAEPQYSCAYVACINAIEKSKFEALKRTPRIKDVKVIPLDFHVVEQRVFSMNDPNAFFDLYSLNSTEERRTQQIKKIGQSLASFLYCLNINPVVRAITKQPNALSPKIVEALQQSYIDISSSPVVEAFNPAEKTARKLNVIVADRIFDLVTPLLTEFTYQAMVYDTLPVKKDTVIIKTKAGDKPMVLNEEDTIWRETRHMHIAQASPFVVEEFNTFVAEHKGVGNAKGAKDMKEMGEMMKKLPEYIDLMTRFSNHMELISRCFNVNEEKKLDEFASGEQIMATGLDKDGKEVKKAFPYISSSIGNVSYPSDLRLRQVLIYLFSQEYSDDDKNALINALHGDEDVAKIISAALSLPKTEREITKKKKGDDNDDGFVNSRFVPYIKEIVMRMSNNDVPDYCVLNKLNFAGFPVTIEQKTGNITVAAGKTLKKQKAKEDKKEGKLTAKKEAVSEKDLLGSDSNVLVIFITGAISYSEMRIAYELSDKLKMNVFIGSNVVARPNNFVKIIKSVKNDSFSDITGTLE
ncbi:vesicle protein sorting-associated, putative [Entamoeba invadens IP1]|uniref:Vesicle protein sorting-associated, putative n=1 Tax=Entamoeba invadens IP1 TaxID=370355 RepID=A0A0A1TVX6_ENTIV|nr:vesicle protein sorting-associated, putative [Entamoeba invadens IP1]ELP84647.1 vesicle protein sorting-associated, putative [Entamoeba invadens IP1]|eukprot:XP_004183993.1 vesicle protein sorting-associated, putative [Entamoeba invadens IP1]